MYVGSLNELSQYWKYIFWNVRNNKVLYAHMYVRANRLEDARQQTVYIIVILELRKWLCLK